MKTITRKWIEITWMIWVSVMNPTFFISNLGEVRRDDKILKGGVGNQGYPVVSLPGYPSYLIHALVARGFLGPSPNASDSIRFKDRNVRPDNLYYK